MHELFQKATRAILNYYELDEVELFGKSRVAPLPECRKFLCYIMKGFDSKLIADLLYVDPSVVRYNIRKMKNELPKYRDLSSRYQAVIDQIEDMKIKLSTNQLEHLYSMLCAYLMDNPEDMAAALIYELIDEINERIRLRIKQNKQGLNLNSKHAKAFSIWYVSRSESYVEASPQGLLVCQDIIMQIKPEYGTHFKK